MDKKIQMMDAGMVLFQTEKPFGNVLGGIKTELIRFGKVYRRNELQDFCNFESVGDFDLLLDCSSLMRKRYVACRLEEAGTVGKTEDGEDVHRYACCFLEGNCNTVMRKVAAWAIAAILIAAGITGIPAVPGFITVLLGFALAGFVLFQILRPGRSNLGIIESLTGILKEAK